MSENPEPEKPEVDPLLQEFYESTLQTFNDYTLWSAIAKEIFQYSSSYKKW